MLKPLLKSRKARSLLAAGCVAGSTGCVSAPKPLPRPPPAECPPGAAATHKRFGLILGDVHGAHFGPVFEGVRYVPVREGEISAEIIGPWGLFPDWTRFSGRLYFGEDRVYGRFTAATLPNGETVPVCLQLLTIGGNHPLGIEKEAGSTATRPVVYSSVSVQAVDRFK